MRKLSVVLIVSMVVFVGCSIEYGSEEVEEVESTGYGEEDSAQLTKALLVQNEWGAENGGLGKWIEFHEDNTFKTIIAEPTDALPVSGTYQLDNNVLTLNNEHYGDDLITEEEQYSRFPKIRTFTLKTTSSSLYLTQFLEEKDGWNYIYWNQNSLIPEGNERIVFGQTLVMIGGTPMPTSDAVIYKDASTDLVVTFQTCVNTDCNVYSADEAVYRVIAKTKDKEEVNGKQDYWYYVDLESVWYAQSYINGVRSEQGIQFGWIHGSEME